MDTYPLLGELGPEAKNFTLRTPRGEYLALDKGFGAVKADTLVDLANQLETNGTPEDLECAASALIESALFNPARLANIPNDSALYVEYAGLLMEKAIAGHYHQLETGHLHPDNLRYVLRARMNAAFIGLYGDLVNGDIRQHTRNQTYSELAEIGRFTLEHHTYADPEFVTDSVGIAFEIATLLAVITETDRIIAVPSTPRAGNGMRNPHRTHDFNYLGVDETGAFIVNTPIELKSIVDIGARLEADRRYDSTNTLLIYTQDIHLYFDDLKHIFAQRTITPSARSMLAPVRDELFGRVGRFTISEDEGVRKNVFVEYT